VTWATWLAIAICGPGALFVFAWFLCDLLRLRRLRRGPPPRDRTENERKAG
jgi:hypothetical protein